jgi:hypothetical protein
MSNNTEKFRAALRSGQLTQAFVSAFTQVVELEVTTWINSQNNPQTTPPPEARSRSKLNLLTNKVETEVGERFLNHPHSQTLQQFHQQQTSQANPTIQANLHCLEQLLRTFASFEQLAGEIQSSSLSAAANFSPASISELPEPENNIVADLLDSLDVEPEEEWDDEASEEEVETHTPEILTVEDLEVGEAEADWGEEDDGTPLHETEADWQPEAAEVDAIPNFDLKQVNWRPISQRDDEPDPGTEADWDELDHELDLDSPDEKS